MIAPFSRKHLSAAGLLSEARRCFAQIPDVPGNEIALVDHLMSGLALFGLKYPSLPQFENDRREEATRANLRALYGIERAPSDTRFRERLDELDPHHLRPLYKALLAQLQRGKGLEGFACLDGHYLLSLDGTGSWARRIGRGAMRGTHPPRSHRCNPRGRFLLAWLKSYTGRSACAIQQNV